MGKINEFYINEQLVNNVTVFISKVTMARWRAIDASTLYIIYLST